MKKSRAFILFGLALMASSFAEDIPDFITKGFDAYQKTGAEAAWKTWNVNYGSQQEAKKKIFLEQMSLAEKTYGAFIGTSLIKEVDASPFYREIHILVRFEKAPLFFTFQCYRPKDSWTIVGLSFSSKPEWMPGFEKHLKSS